MAKRKKKKKKELTDKDIALIKENTLTDEQLQLFDVDEMVEFLKMEINEAMFEVDGIDDFFDFLKDDKLTDDWNPT